MRNRSKLSEQSLAKLVPILEVVQSLQEYLPLTLRQLYYQLVAAGIIDNNLREYQKLSQLLTKARLEGYLPWEAMEDRARAVLNSDGWTDEIDFKDYSMERFLKGYRRDLLQTQEVALEIWIEKDALSRIVYDTAFPYCVSVIVARGFSSVTFVNECRNRINRNYENDKHTLILYFGDLDPSGYEMPLAMQKTLEEEMDCYELFEIKRCALNLDQVSELNLPNNPDALKWKDPRAKRYVEEFGEFAVELDAVPPAELERIVRESIEDNLDMDLYYEEEGKEED